MNNNNDTDYLPLSTYLQAIKMAIDDIFATPVWVIAEIRAINSKSGHYYLELAEKDNNGTIGASCRATLWRSSAVRILKKFEQQTQLSLAAGLKVLLHGRANFHSQYGLSFVIDDINPSYTLGELAAAYDAMKQKLNEHGLLHLNKRLATPFDIAYVLVIAPENAAGLGDFRADADILSHAKVCQFFYHYATFQGNHAPMSIRTAIFTGLNDFIATHQHLPDLLVIIRGGGAVGDLAYLNDYELAAQVAELPIPVWVGIGHEKDKVILDEVAHTRFDTPSKVIIGIKAHLSDVWLNAKRYQQKIYQIATHQLKQSCQQIDYGILRIQQSSVHHCNQAKTLQQLHLKSIHQHAKTQLNLAEQNSRYQLERHRVIYHHLSMYRKNIEHWRMLTFSYHPKQVLNKGYILVHDNKGAIITSQAQTYSHMQVWLEFKDGKTKAVII